MAELATSRKARLRACERVLSDHLEEWVKVGIALTEIRDDRLYEEDGYEDFRSYLSGAVGRFAMGRAEAYRKMEGARIRQHLLPVSPIGDTDEPGWLENQVRNLSKLPTDKKIKQVANRAIKRVENNGVKLGTAVRECVDDEVGAAKTRKRKRKQLPTFAEFLRTKTAEFGKLADAIEEVDDAYLRGFVDDHGITTKDLKAEMSRLHTQFNRIWTYLP